MSHFQNQRVVSGLAWRTEAASFQDRERGKVDLTVAGLYTVRVSDRTRFQKAFQVSSAPEAVELHLQRVIVSAVHHKVGEKLQSAIDLPTLYNELATEIRLELTEDFSRIGVDLIDFFVTKVVPPDEVRRFLDERMGAVRKGPKPRDEGTPPPPPTGDPPDDPSPGYPGPPTESEILPPLREKPKRPANVRRLQVAHPRRSSFLPRLWKLARGRWVATYESK